MNNSSFLKLAFSLSALAGLASPSLAQVSTGLQQSAFGGTVNVSTGALTPASTGFSALSTVGATTTTSTVTGGVETVSGITKTSGSGGKVGTFQASLSEGDQQRFAVGTSTNIGVNASSSSTSDYQVNSNATFGVGSSSLRQTIGTAGISQTSQAREQASSSYADTSVGSSSSSYFEKAKREIATDATSSSRYSWWQTGMATQSYDQATTNQTTKTAIETNYSTAYGSAKSEYSSSASSAEASNGVISGSFVSNSKTTTTPAGDEANNQVTVKGIGNTASVNAMSNSNFSSVVSPRSGTPAAGSSGTASGSAGANVSSTASADAAATKFSSVFIQSY
ncbi:hypothetical protein KBY58_11385 [Cyanobium sp. HWJ4-Hawea]|uniref:hypothetical protein n=1 Tax=Cyanobium sp. HWJ4-Hawea TaxID=2823713 RepID=UPI0020CD5AF3|nr:hypothetical protein [Cyanobium sp. HWJ4-Hawea]MCP9810037.1 hypothetical protein [Cyanobium sp. HWJ4-Hawea]